MWGFMRFPSLFSSDPAINEDGINGGIVPLVQNDPGTPPPDMEVIEKTALAVGAAIVVIAIWRAM